MGESQSVAQTWGKIVEGVDVTAGSADYIWTMPFDRRGMSRALEAMIAAVRRQGLPFSERVEMRLVDDNAMRDMNARFMSCPGSTNVLSFPGEGDMPGLILVSSGAISRECLLYGQRPADYILLLLAHGIAHLAGLEHGREMGRMCDACVAAAKRTLG
ncbi:MAG: rRNA maturation RNase YbeY [Desulfovibrio sp.]|jgi:probable rRNA maturation factor|nr:rRNA maturation RNase YbeY [Desulfovibrio sp.]